MITIAGIIALVLTGYYRLASPRFSLSRTTVRYIGLLGLALLLVGGTWTAIDPVKPAPGETSFIAYLR